MRLITADGTEMVAHNPNTASTLAVAHLQQTTGWKLTELAANLKQDWVDLPGLGRVEQEIAARKVLEYLSEHTRGNMLAWADVLARPLPALVYDSDDERRRSEEAAGGDAADPTQAGTGTPAADTLDAPAVEPQRPASTRASKRSGARSPGSSSRSASAR